MSIDTTLWAWPQFTMIVWLLLGATIAAVQHGEPKVDKKTGKPETYSGFIALLRVAMWLFILAAGGFFK